MDNKKKIIPQFWIPKEYPEDMKLLIQGLVEGHREKLRAALDWLEGKVVSHTGKKAGSPKDRTTLSNYLKGFYALDLFKANGYKYSDASLNEKITISINSEIELDQDLIYCIQTNSKESFEERFVNLCLSKSYIVQQFTADYKYLIDEHKFKGNERIQDIQALLIERRGYKYVGNPGVSYLKIFYKEKEEIDNYLRLLDFIKDRFKTFIEENLGFIPLHQIISTACDTTNLSSEQVKDFLLKLHLTGRLELRTTKTGVAKNMSLNLVEIDRNKYGFVRLTDQ